MTDRTFTARVVKMERMRSSVNGNPRFRIYLDNGEDYPTQPDAMFAYGAENPEIQGTWRDREAGTAPLVEWHVNGRGHITYGKPLDAES